MAASMEFDEQGICPPLGGGVVSVPFMDRTGIALFGRHHTGDEWQHRVAHIGSEIQQNGILLGDLVEFQQLTYINGAAAFEQA